MLLAIGIVLQEKRNEKSKCCTTAGQTFRITTAERKSHLNPTVGCMEIVLETIKNKVEHGDTLLMVF